MSEPVYLFIGGYLDGQRRSVHPDMDRRGVVAVDIPPDTPVTFPTSPPESFVIERQHYNKRQMASVKGQPVFCYVLGDIKDEDLVQVILDGYHNPVPEDHSKLLPKPRPNLSRQPGSTP